MKDHDLTSIGIADVDFLVEQRIEGCPPVMLLREFVQNAIEARGNSRIKIDHTLIDGIPKLTVWNDGDGMSGAFLEEMTHLAKSGKTLSRAENFGMGAKVAGLKLNKAGIRYRSCNNCEVSELVLKKHGHRYVRSQAKNISGQFNQRLRSSDWTEVVLMGNQSGQNTTRDPYDGQIVVDRDWIVRDLHQRFYDLPQNAEIQISAAARNRKRGTLHFIPIRRQLELVARHETVSVSNGVSISYIHDPRRKTRFPRCALEHREEMYDVITGQRWSWEAPRHGIIFGANEISVIIHLPRDYPCRIEDYRRHLVSTEGDEPIILGEGFAAIVAANIPNWLREVINSKRPADEEYEANVYKEMLKLFRELGLKKKQYMPTPEGNAVKRAEGIVERVRKLRGKGRKQPSPAPTLLESPEKLDTKGTLRDATYPVPRVEWLETEESIAEHDLVGRFGRYVEESQIVFLNRNYGAIEEMFKLLRNEYRAEASPSALTTIETAVRRVFHIRVYEHLAIATDRRMTGPAKSLRD